MSDSSEEGKKLVGELKTSLRELIKESLSKRYISRSSLNEIPTGNRYQSVELGGGVDAGFRADRSLLFERFNFRGRSVLDCGCNLGELSRISRRRGARLVDGFEYENYFVNIGRLINALNDVTRVSLYQRDLTDPSVFVDDYDVALAFSVFPYVEKVLETLCSKIKEALILETHDIKPNLHDTYIRPLTKFFPHYSFVDITDHSHGQGRRAVLLFTRTPVALTAHYGLLKSSIDVSASKLSYLEDFERHVIQPLGAASADDISQLAERLRPQADDGKLISGTSYWAAMLRGYSEFLRSGLSPENTYVKYFKVSLASPNLDPALSKKLSSDLAVLERVRRRFNDASVLREHSQGISRLDPVRVINPLDEDGKNTLVHAESGRKIKNSHLDGYHRLFWARLFGVSQLPAIFHIEETSR